MPRRLIAEADQRRWERQLRESLGSVYGDFVRKFRHKLERDHGVSLTAAGARPPGGSKPTGEVWNDTEFNAAVAETVQPTAEEIAAAMEDQVEIALPSVASWGRPTKADEFVSTFMSAVSSVSGPLADRFNERAATVAALQSTVESDAAAGAAYRSERARNQAESALRSGRSAIADALDGGAAQFDNLSESFVNSWVNGFSQDATSYLAGLAGDVYRDATVTWNAVGDDRTRDAHADADGQEVGLNEAFDVDGEALLYPGDPSGSDENTINCRCWLTYDGISEADAESAEEES